MGKSSDCHGEERSVKRREVIWKWISRAAAERCDRSSDSPGESMPASRFLANNFKSHENEEIVLKGRVGSYADQWSTRLDEGKVCSFSL